MLDFDPRKPLYRVLFSVAGVAIIGVGVASLRRGDLFYENRWGGLVFAPLAIVFGIIFIALTAEILNHLHHSSNDRLNFVYIADARAPGGRAIYLETKSFGIDGPLRPAGGKPCALAPMAQ